ncbi:uncharacterized protein LOC118761299 [Octopus sinensis]|uniref:Uncharacterized protein LOC118761299 n=1 Tax=Octopus sinensis TaxID=2607531 RepID=A0A7E6EJD1_9MOLL|nr:uncharacterized protein LOC118761299 [Octopus sinensis]
MGLSSVQLYLQFRSSRRRVIPNLFTLFYSVNGIFRERKFELYALALSVLVVIIYVIIHYIIPNSTDDLNFIPKANLTSTFSLTLTLSLTPHQYLAVIEHYPPP